MRIVKLPGQVAPQKMGPEHRLRFNARLHAFARYWGFAPRACAPCRARTKGKDERGVGYVKKNAIAGRRFESWGAFEAHLDRWTREIADRRVHGTTGVAPAVRFPEEVGALRSLAGRAPFGQLRDLVRKVQSDCAVDLDTNSYSVPWRLIGESELAACRWIAHGDMVLLLGPPGTGKTHLAVALGREAIRQNYSVQFVTAATLVAMLAKAHQDGQLEKQLTLLARPKLLVIDEIGYLPFEANAANLFFQLVSLRYERGSILITSNRSVGEWGSVFGDAVVATAILDRLLHHSHVITIRGDSYRLREKRRSGLLQKTGPAPEPRPTAAE